MKGVRCPICDAAMPGDWREYPDYPFCTKRCRVIDLGRWLDGNYKVSEPAVSADESESALPDDE